MEIKPLPPEVVDQIAAGEVVERPSHMVKELAENSIDAGATKLIIEVSEGGRRVQVSDNGRGISKEDLALALERFATSKITEANDIWKLNTFGFRGEALASIASVSRVGLTSRMPHSETAWKLVSEFGKKSEVVSVGSGYGTTVSIQNLFKNIPARLKFLKTDAGELSSIRNTVKALALSHPGVEMRYSENGKLHTSWLSCEDKLSRVTQVLQLEKMYEGTSQRGNVKVHAVFADPRTTGKTSRNIWIFVQNRWVQDRGIQAAVMESYRNLLMHGEFPQIVVWVETDPEFVDVNIHPTKSQIKFQDTSLVFRAVQSAIRDQLEKAPWIPKEFNKPDLMFNSPVKIASHDKVESKKEFSNLSFQDSALEKTQFKTKSFFSDNYKNSTVEISNPSLFSKGSEFRTLSGRENDDESLIEIKSEMESESGIESIKLNQREAVFKSDLQVGPLNQNLSSNQNLNKSEESLLKKGYWSNLHLIGQVNLTYIACQTDGALVLVDQHAAHERIVFEQMMKAWSGGKMETQEYLFPLAIDLPPERVEVLFPYLKELEKMGLFIESLGPSTIGIKGAPLLVKERALVKALDQMSLDIYENGGSFSIEKCIANICATMACHSVVRAGQAMSSQEMRSLLSDMDQFPLSSFCPHGRPVSVEFGFSKIEKEFGRIV